MALLSRQRGRRPEPSCFGAAAGADDAPPSSTTINEPSETLSPILTRISLTVPASGDGTSIVALSDSSVTSDCSFSTVSPTFTLISMTGMSLKSPISGTFTSIVPPPEAAGAAAVSAGFAAAALGASAAGAACAPPSSTTINEPSDTLSPTLTFTSLTMPASVLGTSMVALSDSSVTSDCSFSTVSPTFTSTSITGISL
jgi:hypothetical protein